MVLIQFKNFSFHNFHINLAMNVKRTKFHNKHSKEDKHLNRYETVELKNVIIFYDKYLNCIL